MQIDLSTVLGFVSAMLSLGLGAWVGLARITIANREKEIDRRLDDCRAETRAQNERLHTEEKATIQQNGEIARLRDTLLALRDDVLDQKKHAATKRDLEHLEGSIGTLQAHQAQQAARYQTPANTSYRLGGGSRQQEESTTPPRGEKNR